MVTPEHKELFENLRVRTAAGKIVWEPVDTSFRFYYSAGVDNIFAINVEASNQLQPVVTGWHNGTELFRTPKINAGEDLNELKALLQEILKQQEMRKESLLSQFCTLIRSI